MCEWGNSVTLKVFTPAYLSHTGKGRWAEKGIDSCIAPIVQALNDAGVTTIQSCCGHGKAPGLIHLLDGRVLTISRATDGT